MKTLAIVKAEIGGEVLKVILTGRGWRVPGHPDSMIPAVLDRLTLDRHTPDEGNPIPLIAQHAAKILGGTCKVYAKFKPKPGMIY